jgi:GntR family uxuAB operon transcriptional repressor
MAIAAPPVYARELSERILAATLGAGRLPPERQLAAEFGVTRTTVRNALALLESEGRISREVGRGTFVRSSNALPGTPRDTFEFSPADVMAARRLFEPMVMPLVVAWATARDFEAMDRCLIGSETATTLDEYEHWDFALHHAIVAAGRNELLIDMYRTVERARQGALWGSLKRRNDSPQSRAASAADHRDLVEALRAREVATAIEVMDRHLARVQANLLGATSA